MICLNENYHVKNMIVQSNFIKIEYWLLSNLDTFLSFGVFKKA